MAGACSTPAAPSSPPALFDLHTHYDAHDFPGGEWRRIQRASGYRFVLVNGAVTIEDDRETDTYSGRLLRHGAM